MHLTSCLKSRQVAGGKIHAHRTTPNWLTAENVNRSTVRYKRLQHTEWAAREIPKYTIDRLTCNRHVLLALEEHT